MLLSKPKLEEEKDIWIKLRSVINITFRINVKADTRHGLVELYAWI